MATTNACDVCGWLAAFGGMLAFGTFGAPIKSRVAQSVDIDPLVFQSYKTGMCFLTSWIILLFGEKFTFTPWGIVSGLFWVPGGIATVYAVKTAGLAIGIGVGSSFIVLVSFTWGIFVFDEHVHSRFGACFAVSAMITGLFGMAYFSAPVATPIISNDQDTTNNNTSIDNHNANLSTSSSSMAESYRPLNNDINDNEIIHDTSISADQNNENNNESNNNCDNTSNNNDNNQDNKANDNYNIDTTNNNTDNNEEDPSSLLSSTNNNAANQSMATTSSDGIMAHEAALSRDFDTWHDEENTIPMIDETSVAAENYQSSSSSSSFVLICGIPWQRRTLGILSAMFCGIWGGSVMVPLQWSPSENKGLGYLISFAIGATTVNIMLWILRYFYLCHKHNYSPVKAYYALPSFHFRKMWLAGGTSGLLWSIGNFFSILSVEFLGEGVGYSVVQASMLVSGLWGIFYFGEIRGIGRIAKWLVSASITVFGILLLSYEHHEK